MKKTLLGMCALVCVMSSLAKTPDGWLDDFEAAQRQSQRENKQMLVLFTGSDWCVWCQRLEKEILSQKSFLDGTASTFVRVFLDFPQNEGTLAPERRKMNDILARKYSVRGYPTVLVLNPKGDVQGRTGYLRLSPEDYAKHIRELSAKPSNP